MQFSQLVTHVKQKNRDVTSGAVTPPWARQQQLISLMLQGGKKTLQTSSAMLKSPEIRRFNDPLLHTFHVFLSTEQKLVGLLAFWNRFCP